MNVDEPLPDSEATLLSTLLKFPYHKRNGYVIRLVNNHRNDPALLSLIQELLTTTLLPDRVPFPGNEQDTGGFVTLLFPQSTASKRFLQRELGLVMAAALGEPGILILLGAILHPSTAGKSGAINACVSVSSGATDEQLVDLYRKCVPATQESLQTAMAAAGRIEALKVLKLWKEPPPTKINDPRCVTLERDLRSARPQDRDAIWTRSGLSLIRPYRHLHNPEYVPKDSPTDLVTTLFHLLELYLPPRSPKRYKNFSSIPSSFHKRLLYSFLRSDLPRTLRLVRSTCHFYDPYHKGSDQLELPAGFMHDKFSSRFWHSLSLEDQTEHLLPFVLDLMQVNDHALLKNGQLLSAHLLCHARWQIVVCVVDSALASLKGLPDLESKSAASDRDGIIAFIVEAIDTLIIRLHNIAHREVCSETQVTIELGLGDLLRRSVASILAASKLSASSDGDFVNNFMQRFIHPLLNGPLRRYPPLAQILFESIKGVFDLPQVSKSELVPYATQFFYALKTRRRSVFDIPDNGIVQPYYGIGKTDNDTIFNLLLRLEPPRDHPSFYTDSISETTYTETDCGGDHDSQFDSTPDALSKQQREILWAYFDSPEYICAQLLDRKGKSNLGALLRIMDELPSSPRARLHIVKHVLDHSEMEDDVAASFYPLLDISDAPSRALLQKNTYKRLFTDRLPAYQHLMKATWAQESLKEYITTMKFLIPRIRNEIYPDAQEIAWTFYKNGVVHDILDLLNHASDNEAKELAELYLALEKQNNEAVSRVDNISQYTWTLAVSALAYFAKSPSHPFFQFGMDLQWVREVLNKGHLKAHETYVIAISTGHTFTLSEHEELQRRQFNIASNDARANMGYWRISDERQFVQTLLQQYDKVHQTIPFARSEVYHSFITDMIKLLGIRWTTVPALCEYTDLQLDILRNISSKETPADWSGKPQREAVQFILALRALYYEDEVTLPWWSEFRHLRLLSTDASVEVDLLLKETFDKGKQSQEKLDMLVEKLLDIDDTAVYLPFVRNHLINNRQDILKDSHITIASVGLFNQLPNDITPQSPHWNLTSTIARRLYPRQCQVFAAKFLKTIHSGEVSLDLQVKAAEQLTKLPTTTVIELAELLKEDLNQRVIEAILMFLPHLDEPASGIQFLLAPTYLDSDLARTVVFSIRNALQHVPAARLPNVLVPVFPPEDSKRLLKITVMKELVRLVCQHISYEEHQTLLQTLWKRKLHQDVRIVVLQSVIPLLGSKYEDLAWTILQDAVSNPALVMDDALFALLAIRPAVPSVVESDVQMAYIVDPDILIDMAQNAIPTQCHENYTENVLFPVAQLSLAVTELSADIKEKEAKLVRERLRLLRQSAFHTIFSSFLTGPNAQVFAQRGLDAAKIVTFSDKDAVDLFPYFVYGIGKCVTLDPRCWDVLCQLVDFLADAVGSPASEPTKTSLKAIRRLHAMNLGSNMTFQRPESLRNSLVVDRMSLLQPLIRRGCDHFVATCWERRFYLFSQGRLRASSQGRGVVLASELDVARSLLLDLTHLAGELQYDLAQLKSKTQLLIDTTSTPVGDTLVQHLLSGSNGLGDVIWINELRLQVLSQRSRHTLDHAQAVAAFQTHVSNYHQSFYARNLQVFSKMVESVLTVDPESKPKEKNLFTTLLDPIFDRVKSSALDVRILQLLLKTIPDVVFRHGPQWAVNSIDVMLSSWRAWEVKPDTLDSVIPLVAFVNSTSIQGNSAASKTVKPSDFSPLAALLIDAIYRGNLRNVDLAKVISSSPTRTEPVLAYPYFVTGQDDGSGGDIENRQSKATVAQLLNRYQQWQATNAPQYISNTFQPQTPPSVLTILRKILGRFPQLTLTHPSLFLSYAVLTFGQSELDTKAKIDHVLRYIQNAVMPKREGESGTLWGWAPPLSLALSFAQVLFIEIATEAAEAVLDDCLDTGAMTCKLAALQLLEWWTDTFYGLGIINANPLGQLVQAMERGEGRENLMSQYDELRVLACRDESRVVRERAFTLRMGDSLKID